MLGGGAILRAELHLGVWPRRGAGLHLGEETHREGATLRGGARLRGAAPLWGGLKGAWPREGGAGSGRGVV